MPVARNLAIFDGPEARFCPAGVYEYLEDEETHETKLQVAHVAHVAHATHVTHVARVARVTRVALVAEEAAAWGPNPSP